MYDIEEPRNTHHGPHSKLLGHTEGNHLDFNVDHGNGESYSQNRSAALDCGKVTHLWLLHADVAETVPLKDKHVVLEQFIPMFLSHRSAVQRSEECVHDEDSRQANSIN